MKFKNEAHRHFYESESKRLKADLYLSTLIYTVGICGETRSHWKEIYNESKKEINRDIINASWQTGTSLKVTRLAFNLYTDYVPTAVEYENGLKDFDECKEYSVSEIFCCEYAFYFMIAINLRYAEYFHL